MNVDSRLKRREAYQSDSRGMNQFVGRKSGPLYGSPVTINLAVSPVLSLHDLPGSYPSLIR
jgi:hypothetical protein